MKARYFDSEYVSRSPADVFALLSNPAMAPSYRGDIVRSEKLSPGPLDVGSRFLQTRKLRGREVTSEIILSRYEPETHVSICGGDGGIVIIDHYTLMPQAAGTWIDWSRQFLGRGVRKLVLPAIAATVNSQDINHVWQLKVHLESN